MKAFTSSVALLGGLLVMATGAQSLSCASQRYKGTVAAYDGWCQASCTMPVPNCPAAFCVCDDAQPPQPTCSGERVCEDGLYLAVPGSTASDAWCSLNCNHKPSNCPCSMCECLNGACHSSPCQNGGVCSSVGDEVTCTCPPDYTGVHCE